MKAATSLPLGKRILVWGNRGTGDTTLAGELNDKVAS
jgi:MoxR-like ATPase